MLKPEQIPDEVVDAAVAMRDRGGSMSDIIRTAINAWPGMHDYKPNAEPYYGKHITLPCRRSRNMTDIVERLRWRAENTSNPTATTPMLCAEAADTITTLRAEVEKLRAALSKISEYEIEEGCPCNACQHSAIARAALKEGQ